MDENFKKRIEDIVGIKRVFKIVEVLHTQYTNIAKPKGLVVYLEGLDTRKILYCDFCCRLYDVILVIEKLGNFNETTTLIKKINEIYEIELPIYSEKLECQIKDILREYRNYYTHPDFSNLEARIYKSKFCEFLIREEFMEDLYELTKDCVEKLYDSINKEDKEIIESKQRTKYIMMRLPLKLNE